MRGKKNRYSNSCVVRKKNSERNKKKPFKLNGRSLSHYSDVREMADYTIASSVNIEKGKQNEECCVEQVISFQQQTNMEKVSDEVVYPEESTLKKMDHGMWPLVALLSLYSDKTRHQTFHPDYEEPIQVTSYRNLIPN